MENNFTIPSTPIIPSDAQQIASELFKKFPNMVTPKPVEDKLKENIKAEVKEDFAKAQEIALKTPEGQQALKEFEESKKKLIDELISQLPKGAEILNVYKEKITSIYKDQEANKVEEATKAANALNDKYKNLQAENEAIKQKLEEVLKKLDNKNVSSNLYSHNK